VLGILLLVHLLCGLILPYVLLGPAMTPAGSVVGRAAGHAASMRTAVFLFVFAAGLVVASAIVAWPVFRRLDERLATAFLALAIANLPLQLFESGTVLTILSLGQHVAANGIDAPLIQAAAAPTVIARRWAHYTQLLTIVGWMFVLYLTLWRTRLVPRVLAALGMLTTVLQIAGVPARAFLGLGVMMELAMPLAPVHLALVLWLMVRGFTPAPHAPHAGTGAVALDAA
jgi:hypothetical protein